jgi:hypothetical protein
LKWLGFQREKELHCVFLLKLVAHFNVHSVQQEPRGFEKNLTSDEIIGQLWLANFADENPINITNVVFHGAWVNLY